MVARTWRRWHAPVDLAIHLPDRVTITAAWCHGRDAAILAEVADTQSLRTLGSDTSFMRSPRRPALQTLLAAPLAGRAQPNPQLAKELVRQTDRKCLLFATLPPPAALPSRCTYLEVPTAHWQGLLPYLIRAAHLTRDDDIRDLQRTVIAWATQPALPLIWTAAEAQHRAGIRPMARAQVSAGTAQAAVAEHVFEHVIDRIQAGSLAAGDHVTESSVARTLHTSRTVARDALRTLASTGLLDYRGSRGVLVPTPTRADVFDTYAARRALGAEVLRRAIGNPALDLVRVESALADVLSTARTGDSYATGNADLRFQDVVAQCSGMRTVPPMMATLSRQLQVYIAVLGLGYIYPISEMVADDTELLRCLRTRDTRAAVRVWNRKIDATLRFMTAHVARAR